MAGNSLTRVLSLILLGACTALCQQAKTPANSLPDAPAVLTSSQPGSCRSLLHTPCLPTDTLAIPGEATVHYDPGHFADEPAQRELPDNAAQLFSLADHGASYHGSTSETVLGRVSDAASGIVLTRDDEGNRHLNTSYLLRVLTTAVAHSAYRPYWRRSATQPISDFGSTVGSDAGMNVFQEFKPGILQLVKNHEPRFVAKIEEHVSRR
jgi:hypothetical protein